MAETMGRTWGMRNMLPGRVRMYEDPAESGAAGGAGPAGAGSGSVADAGQAAGTASFDYDKLASIIAGKQTVPLWYEPASKRQPAQIREISVQQHSRLIWKHLVRVHRKWAHSHYHKCFLRR